MKTPFTAEQFFGVFSEYNSTVFPAQLILLALGLIVLYLLHARSLLRSRLIGGFLGGLWLWVGVVYHLLFFTDINKAAYAFGGLFILQSVLFLVETFQKGRLKFDFQADARHYAGYFFVVFGLILYPLIGFVLEADWATTISLGLPCPTTILTFGLLMLTGNKFPKYLLIIPTLWAIIGTMAAFNWGVYQDFMMIIAAIAANIWLWRR